MCGLLAIPRNTLDEFLHGPPPVQIVAPDVVLVTGSGRVRDSVSETVRSRHGYSLRSGRSVDAGLQSVQHNPERIGFVVVDADLAGSGRVASAARAACPNARIVTVSGSYDPAQIASSLIGAGMK